MCSNRGRLNRRGHWSPSSSAGLTTSKPTKTGSIRPNKAARSGEEKAGEIPPFLFTFACHSLYSKRQKDFFQAHLINPWVLSFAPQAYMPQASSLTLQ